MGALRVSIGSAFTFQYSIQEATMSIRLIITLTSAPGRGGELAALLKTRCQEVMAEPGCEQFEVFQSALDGDKLTLLERWADQAALDVHAEVNRTRAPITQGLIAGSSEREDYVYHRTR